MYIESNSKCDECGSRIYHGEKIVCNLCFHAIETENSELKDRIKELEDELRNPEVE